MVSCILFNIREFKTTKSGELKQQIMGKLTVISSPDLADCSLLSIERATSASVLKTDLPAYSRDSDDSM